MLVLNEGRTECLVANSDAQNNQPHLDCLIFSLLVEINLNHLIVEDLTLLEC